MPVVRVYVPVGRSELAELAETGALSAGPGMPRPAHAVTTDLHRAGAGHDLEDLEYTAFCDAVDAAGAARAVPGDRRVVLSADADPESVVERGRTGAVTQVVLTAALPLSRLASLHVDEGAGAGADDDLLWYDATELDEVRRLLG